MTSKLIQAMTKGAYDLQELRIQTGLRLCANFRSKLGKPDQKGNTADEDLSEEALKLIEELKREYTRLCDGVAKSRRLPPRDKFTGTELISSYSELTLIDQYIELERQERRMFLDLKVELDNIPIYRDYLSSVRGIGPAMGAVLVSQLDPYKARHVSSFWKYAGLDVGPDGRGRSKRKEHLIDVTYKTRDGKEETRKSITYNPWLKTKLAGVLSGVLLRANSPYRVHYDNYRHRLQSDPRKAEWTKNHIHKAALRYMIKMLLADLWEQWRKMEGLPVGPRYHEGVLGHVHSHNDEVNPSVQASPETIENRGSEASPG